MYYLYKLFNNSFQYLLYYNNSESSMSSPEFQTHLSKLPTWQIPTWISNPSIHNNLVFSPSTQICLFFTLLHLRKCHHHPAFTQGRNQECSLLPHPDPFRVPPQQVVLVLPPTKAYARSSHAALLQSQPTLPSPPTWIHTIASHLLSLLLGPLQSILHSATGVVVLHLNWSQAWPHGKPPKGCPLLLGSSSAPYPECPHPDGVSDHCAPCCLCIKHRGRVPFTWTLQVPLAELCTRGLLCLEFPHSRKDPG